jgi:uncharacterized membrane protein
MIRILRNIRINAPVEKVYDFLSDPKHLPELWPNVVEVKSVKRAPKGGYSFDWTYKMSGQTLNGKVETTDFTRNQRFVWESTRGFESILRFRFQPEGNLTALTFEMDYTIPSALLKQTKHDVIVQETEHEVEAMCSNIRTKVELEVAYA